MTQKSTCPQISDPHLGLCPKLQIWTTRSTLHTLLFKYNTQKQSHKHRVTGPSMHACKEAKESYKWNTEKVNRISQEEPLGLYNKDTLKKICKQQKKQTTLLLNPKNNILKEEERKHHYSKGSIALVPVLCLGAFPLAPSLLPSMPAFLSLSLSFSLSLSLSLSLSSSQIPQTPRYTLQIATISSRVLSISLW